MASTINNSHASTGTTTSLRRRLFAVGPWGRFRFHQTRLIDWILDCFHTTVEYIIYLFGPLLIILALSIMSILTYTFFTILLPMLRLQHAAWFPSSPFINQALLGLHVAGVVWVLLNVLYNYFYCVMTRHSGPHVLEVLRELAAVTHLGTYPETPEQIAQYQRDYQDRMMWRIHHHRQRASAAAPRTSRPDPEAGSASLTTVAGSQDPSTNVANGPHQGTAHHQATSMAAAAPELTQRRVGQHAPPPPPPVRTSATTAAPPPWRGWMLLGPFEWGYCANSKQPKPPRSHYDHVSKQLVLNLDHYCPWMFNAVGYWNYRYFVNFLIFVSLGMMYGAALTWYPFWLLQTDAFGQQALLERQARRDRVARGANPAAPFSLPDRLQPMLPYRHEKMLISLAFMMCAAVGLAVLALCLFHLYLTVTAQTTIEFHANWAHRRRAQQQHQHFVQQQQSAGGGGGGAHSIPPAAKWKNPYSTGTWRGNWEQVYGRHPLLLSLLPSARLPEFLPVPIPGHPGRFPHPPKPADTTSVAHDDDENLPGSAAAAAAPERWPPESDSGDHAV